MSGERLITRFSLNVRDHEGRQTTHNFDHHEDGSPELKILSLRFEPDNVKLFLAGNYSELKTLGDVDYRDMIRQRQERRLIVQRIAGKLGDHWLDNIEKSEGWEE